VLFFHGGGCIFGHIDLFDGPVSRYVSASGVPMLSVEYRRTPEHPFPTPLGSPHSRNPAQPVDRTRKPPAA
jgi:acetyl esterase/lipase